MFLLIEAKQKGGKAALLHEAVPCRLFFHHNSAACGASEYFRRVHFLGVAGALYKGAGRGSAKRAGAGAAQSFSIKARFRETGISVFCRMQKKIKKKKFSGIAASLPSFFRWTADFPQGNAYFSFRKHLTFLLEALILFLKGNFNCRVPIFTVPLKKLKAA